MEVRHSIQNHAVIQHAAPHCHIDSREWRINLNPCFVFGMRVATHVLFVANRFSTEMHRCIECECGSI